MNGIYKCLTEDKEIIYIGSSGVTIDKLESNHRNYFKYENGNETVFRKILRAEGSNWTFEWVVKPFDCNKKTIETIEGAFINELTPLYNIDKNTVRSSINYKRYK